MSRSDRIMSDQEDEAYSTDGSTRDIPIRHQVAKITNPYKKIKKSVIPTTMSPTVLNVGLHKYVSDYSEPQGTQDTNTILQGLHGWGDKLHKKNENHTRVFFSKH
jgi:hypothetical protein